MLRQDFAVDARLVVEALHLGPRSETGQVVVSFIAGGQQDQVVMQRAIRRPRAVRTVTGRDIGFAANDGLDAFGPGGFIEVHGAVHHAVIGYGHRRHAGVIDGVHQIIDAAGAVQQAEACVQVQVSEVSLLVGHGMGILRMPSTKGSQFW